MKRSRNRKAKAAPVELTENQLGDVAGGYMQFELENTLISSYSLSSGGDRPNESVDETLSSATPKR